MQPPATGVIVYVITAFVVPVLTGVSVIAPLPDAVTPVAVPEVTAPVQFKVDVIEVDAVKFKAVFEQIVVVRLEGVLVITGDGFTVTVTLTGVPEHPLAVGVI